MIVKSFEGWTCSNQTNLQFYIKDSNRLGMPECWNWREFDRKNHSFVYRMLLEKGNEMPPGELMSIWENEMFWVTGSERVDNLSKAPSYILNLMGKQYSLDESLELIEKRDWLTVTKCIFEQTNGLY